MSLDLVFDVVAVGVIVGMPELDDDWSGTRSGDISKRRFGGSSFSNQNIQSSLLNDIFDASWSIRLIFKFKREILNEFL